MRPARPAVHIAAFVLAVLSELTGAPIRSQEWRKIMGLRTRLTEALGITVPILSAPMGFVAGGKLAAAVTAAGGLGIIGGGYGDAAWLDREFAEAGNARVRCGFINWSLARKPEML